MALPESGHSSDYDDLVQSSLLAQLVANKKIEDAKVESWYDAYIAVLDDFWVRSLKSREDFLSLRQEQGRRWSGPRQCWPITLATIRHLAG
ncbi:hypothetical protein V5O39_20265 [Pseudomonas parakoreensis]